MAQRSFKLDDDLDAKLVAEAGRQGRSVSNLIVWALVRELGNHNHHSDPGPEYAREVMAKSKEWAKRLGPEGTPLPKIAPRKPQ